jgi:hypothetical protein
MANLNVETLGWFLALVFPGFVSLKVYSLVIPSARRQGGEVAFDLLAYGTINAGINLPMLTTVRSAYAAPDWLEAAAFGTALLVVPALTGFVFAQLRKSGFLAGLGILHPIPRAWDFYFRQGRRALVIITFKDGNMIGGYFGSDSFASSFPHEDDLYIERVCRVDPETGGIVRFVPNSSGMLIHRSDCKTIEFIDVE